MGRGSEAPQARQMVARGKCERSEYAAPGSRIKSARAPEGRQTRWPVSVGLPGLYFFSRTFRGLRASRSPLATICRAGGARTRKLTNKGKNVPPPVNEVGVGGGIRVGKRPRPGRWGGGVMRGRRGGWGGVVRPLGGVVGRVGHGGPPGPRCPWITDKSARAPQGRPTRWPVSVGLPGLYFFFRMFQGLRASRSPLATICRACGAGY
jgi:hypothetical protein